MLRSFLVNVRVKVWLDASARHAVLAVDSGAGEIEEKGGRRTCGGVVGETVEVGRAGLR